MSKRHAIIHSSFKPFYLFLLVTVVAELFLVLIIPHFLNNNSNSISSFFFNGRILHVDNFLADLNPAIQSLWIAEILGLLTSGTYLFVNHSLYKLQIIFSPIVGGFLGLYGILFGYYYPTSYPASFNGRMDSALPYLIRANLWLIGGLIAGWLIGKGLESIAKKPVSLPMNKDQSIKQMPDDYWKHRLTKKQYNIARRSATEIPFTGKYNYNHRQGAYNCVACGQQLFSSDTKFNSYSGWPSFTDPINSKNVLLRTEKNYKTLGTAVTEVSCANCGAHLGHLFADGPVDKGGNRYCINSAILDFKPAES